MDSLLSFMYVRMDPQAYAEMMDKLEQNQRRAEKEKKLRLKKSGPEPKQSEEEKKKSQRESVIKLARKMMDSREFAQIMHDLERDEREEAEEEARKLAENGEGSKKSVEVEEKEIEPEKQRILELEEELEEKEKELEKTKSVLRAVGGMLDQSQEDAYKCRNKIDSLKYENRKMKEEHEKIVKELEAKLLEQAAPIQSSKPKSKSKPGPWARLSMRKSSLKNKTSLETCLESSDSESHQKRGLWSRLTKRRKKPIIVKFSSETSLKSSDSDGEESQIQNLQEKVEKLELHLKKKDEKIQELKMDLKKTMNHHDYYQDKNLKTLRGKDQKINELQMTIEQNDKVLHTKDQKINMLQEQFSGLQKDQEPSDFMKKLEETNQKIKELEVTVTDNQQKIEYQDSVIKVWTKILGDQGKL